MTPYDTAIRIQQRETDELRLAISVEVHQLVQIDLTREAVASAVVREAETAAADPMMSTFAFLTRMRTERTRLDADKAAAGQRLDRLRDKAMTTYGSLCAIEVAADAHRQEESRAAARAEQARMDDFSSAAFLRARSLRSAARGRVG